MQQMLRLMIAAARGCRVRAFAGAAMAQGRTVKQIKLTDKQIEGFIAAQKDMAAVAEKMQGSSRQARSQGAGRARGHRQEARLARLRASMTTSPPTSPW